MTDLKIVTKDWEESDLSEVSQFVFENRIGIYKNAEDAEGIKRYLSNIQERFPAEVIFEVNKKESLCGWVALDRESKSVAELGRWQPIVAKSKNEDEIASNLIQEVLEYAKKNGITRLEISFNNVNPDNQEEYERSAKWLNANEIPKLQDHAYMTLQLDEFEPKITKNRDLSKVGLQYVDEDELYKCYHTTFSSSKDREFLDSSEKQRREKFDEAIHSDVLNKNLSFVWKDGEKIIGFVFVHSRDNEEHIHMFGILEEYREKGIATNLLLNILRDVKITGYRRVSLGVDISNTPAFNLYKKIGFKINSRTIVHSWKSS